MPLQYFFYLRIIFFFATELKKGKQKNWDESGGKGCMYIKDWFKPIFLLLFLTSLFRKLEFIISMFDFAPPQSPNVISQVTPMA
jgi:hypothetical protein